MWNNESIPEIWNSQLKQRVRWTMCRWCTMNCHWPLTRIRTRVHSIPRRSGSEAVIIIAQSPGHNLHVHGGQHVLICVVSVISLALFYEWWNAKDIFCCSNALAPGTGAAGGSAEQLPTSARCHVLDQCRDTAMRQPPMSCIPTSVLASTNNKMYYLDKVAEFTVVSFLCR